MINHSHSHNLGLTLASHSHNLDLTLASHSHNLDLTLALLAINYSRSRFFDFQWPLIFHYLKDTEED